MQPADNLIQTDEITRARKRPFICGLLLTLALTYFLVMALLFSLSLVFSGDIQRVLSQYYTQEEFNASYILIFSLAGSLLFWGSSAGIVLFLLKRKGGFYLFFLTALVILILDFIFLDFDWLRYLILTGFLFTAGVLHLSKRCYA